MASQIYLAVKKVLFEMQNGIGLCPFIFTQINLVVHYQTKLITFVSN